MKKYISLLLSAVMAASALFGSIAAFAGDEEAAAVEPVLLWDFGKDETELYDASSLEYEMGEDSVVFTAKGGDPNIKIKTEIDDVESIAWVKIRIKNPSPSIAVELFASTDGDKHSLAGPECSHIDIVPYADEWQSYVAYLPNANIYTVNTFKGDENVDPIDEWNWKGACDFIRLDPMWRNTSGEMSEGDSVEIDYIAFFDNKEDAVAYASEKDGDEETLGHVVLVPVEFEEGPVMTVLGSVMSVNDSLRFIDISPDDGKYYDAAKYVFYEGLFKGIDDIRFGPDMTMTRAMFVTVLGRANVADTEKYSEKKFSDVEPDTWYGPYVNWASELGFVLGYEDGTFRPDDTLTIEQAAAIVNRYASYPGYSTDPVGDLSAYSDASDVSEWAVPAMTWASDYGVYTGTDGALTPKADAPRKAVALMLYNFINAEIPPKSDAPIAGGWSDPESPVVTEELKAIFDKAMEPVDMDYAPVALLKQQLVSGMNYLFLCKANPGSGETYSFVKVYADLEGGAEMTEVTATDVPTRIDYEPVDGGVGAPETPELTDEVKAAFEKASSKLLGVDYKPVALLSCQTVAGQIYEILCESSVVYPGAPTNYSFVTVFADLEGEAEITNVITLDDAE